MSDSESPVVLVVEDQADLRALLQTILLHHGFRVLLATSASDAKLLFRHEHEAIDIVLLNAQFKGWDGVTALRDLRAVQPEVVVCFITGEVRNGHAEPDWIALGAAQVVRKPFEPSDMAQALWALVRRRDRRGSERSTTQSTRVKVGAGLEPEHVVESWIGDRSLDGLRLRLPEKLGDVGALLSIRPADADEDAPWVPVQIRHVSSEAGQWTVGCRFLHPAAAFRE